MRQTHVAGERMFVDYAGTTLEGVDGTTGEVRSFNGCFRHRICGHSGPTRR
jgi:hypothetical protein